MFNFYFIQSIQYIFNIKLFIKLYGCVHPSDVLQHKPFFCCMPRYVHLDIHLSDVIRGKTVKHDKIHTDLHVPGHSQWSHYNLCVFQGPKFFVFQCVKFAIIFHYIEFVYTTFRGIHIDDFLNY